VPLGETNGGRSLREREKEEESCCEMKELKQNSKNPRLVHK